MAIKELFYDNRPQVLLDPRASQRIDPRFKYTRSGPASYYDGNGILRFVKANEPRFDHDPLTGENLGMLMEQTSTNHVLHSTQMTTGFSAENIIVTPNAGLAPDGTYTATKIVPTTDYDYHYYFETVTTSQQLRTLSVYAKADGISTVWFGVNRFGGQSSSFNLNNGTVINAPGIGPGGIISPAGNGWYRISFPFDEDQRYTMRIMPQSRIQYTGDGTSGILVWGPQIESNRYIPTSYIPTTVSEVTRGADLLSVEAPLPSSGSVYIDARAISANENDTLLSLKNSSNDKIDLAYLSNTSTYDSLALIANYDGTSKPSLPLPVPTTDRERNIITWGAQNYQYGRDSSRFATSLSSSVPTGLNQLSIGHDAVDPTKAFNGYINTVYAWSGELTPAVTEALVRNEIDAINADTYSPTGPAGSLALVINTQGATTSGDKTFTLPAESTADDNDIVITWGDGTESGLDGSDAELGASGLTHTYPAAGIYPVWVEGKMEGIRFNNTTHAKDLLQIAAWGTGDMFTSPSTMREAFYGCTQMDFSSSARTTNRPDTSAVTDWYRAFRDCSSITGTFPAFNFSAATTLQEAWQGCSSMTSFVAAGDQTQNVTNFSSAWYNCSGLTAFPQINTAAGTNFYRAWSNCSSLTSFPLINTSNGSNFSEAWRSCSSLTEFPLINTAAGTNFSNAWRSCSSLDNIVNAGEATSFPLIDTSAGTSFSSAWFACSSFTNFPLINTSAGTNFSSAWRSCSSLTEFPLIDTSSATTVALAWYGCISLETFPLIDTSSVTSFVDSWLDCRSLDNIANAGESTSFPAINTSAGTDFQRAWYNCYSFTVFPFINTTNSTNFRQAWFNCSSLTDFPANFFDSWSGTPVDGCFDRTWDGCSSLTPASVVNILDSIAASGQSAPSGTDTGDKEITIDWDGTGDPATDAATAITTLKSRNWDVVLNGVSQ